jgi:hypothetical protein
MLKFLPIEMLYGYGAILRDHQSRLLLICSASALSAVVKKLCRLVLGNFPIGRTPT